MITSFDVEPKEIKGNATCTVDLGDGRTDFPLLCIDRDSYMISSNIESGVNMKEGEVHNLHIGKFNSIAHYVSFVIDINHDYLNLAMGTSDLFEEQPSALKRKGQIIIQNDVWIGRGATIMAGVTVHNGAVIAANSHVVKDVPPYAIVGGNPAKVIKYRFNEETRRKLLAISWWNWSDEKIKKYRRLFNHDINGFCDEFYSKSIEESKSLPILDLPTGKHNYLFFADFNEKYCLWKKVLLTFCEQFKEDTQRVLIMYIDVQENQKMYLEMLKETLKDVDVKCSIFLYFDTIKNDRAIFRQVEYFITNRSEYTVRHSCYADEFGVKVLSGVDIPIF